MIAENPQAAQQEMLRREVERREWIYERIGQAEKILRQIEVAMSKSRDLEPVERESYRAEIEGLLLGVKNSLLINSFPVPLENVYGLSQKLKEINKDFRLVGDFIVNVNSVKEYLRKHPALAKESSWDENGPQELRIRALSEVMRNEKGEDMLPEQHLQIGTLLGYPEEAVRGFAREMSIRQDNDAPAPQSLDMPASEKEQLYQDEYEISEEDAAHLASKVRRELYLNNASEPVVQAASYGGDSKDWDELERLVEDINRFV